MTNLTIVSDLETIEIDSDTLSTIANEIDENIISEIQDGLDTLESLSNLPLRSIDIERNLTDEELLNLGQIISDDLKLLKAKKDEKKSYDAQLNAEIKVLEDQIFENNSVHQSKTKLEYVSCFYKKNYESGKREYYSTNTGELLLTEPLSSNDYQTQIELPEANTGEVTEEIEPEESQNDLPLEASGFDFDNGVFLNGTDH